MTTPAIDIHGLTKIFGEKTVVNEVSLRVERGTVFGFLGSNGSGKTTMIRMICGLLTPTSGKGFCLGYDISNESQEIKHKIGYMPQKFSLYVGLTVYENLLFMARMYQVKNPHKAIKKIMDDLSLGPFESALASNLSGGWKQRLALACCLVHQPELLFLDEPTAGVDPKARKDFWNYLHKIAMRDGTTVLVTTHYMDEAEKCTDLAYINLGKLLYRGPTKEIIAFSGVKTYRMMGDKEHMNARMIPMTEENPHLLISLINNELRVSSRVDEALTQFIKKESGFKFEPVTPSFEEVFIGLMS